MSSALASASESVFDDEDVEVPLLFEQNYLDEFHKKCGFPSHIKILCKSKFLEWWELKTNTTRSARKKTLEDRKRRLSTEKHLMRARELKIGRAIGPLICKNINKDYADFTMLNVFAGFNDEYDIAVVVDTNAPGSNLTEKRKKIYGFIISQYNEFLCKPNVFALNLVCVNHKSIKKDFGDNPSFGRKLIALYLCSVLRIKDETIKKECILELGGGVSNIAAFLTYIRLGFRADIDMFKDKCINSAESLPMSIDLSHKNKGSISLTQSVRPSSPAIEVAIINAAMGTHMIRYNNDTHNWKKIILMKDRDAQTKVLQSIEQEYFEQLRPSVEANPELYSSSVRKHFGLPGSESK
jgi:hypothetical protein